MEYDLVRTGAALTVNLKGQLNFDANESFALLLHELEKAGASQIVFDLAGLSAMDSVGLGLLYIAHEELDRPGAPLVLRSAAGTVKRLLDLTDASKSFQIQP